MILHQDVVDLQRGHVARRVRPDQRAKLLREHIAVFENGLHFYFVLLLDLVVEDIPERLMVVEVIVSREHVVLFLALVIDICLAVFSDRRFRSTLALGVDHSAQLFRRGGRPGSVIERTVVLTGSIFVG